MINAKVNGVIRKFILDKRASNSSLCNSKENKFKLETEKSKISASSAKSNVKYYCFKKNSIVIGKWKYTIDKEITILKL